MYVRAAGDGAGDQVRGEYAVAHPRDNDSEHVRVSWRFQLVDLTPVVSPLRDTSRPSGQRVRAFVNATKTLTTPHPAFKHALEIVAGTSDSLALVDRSTTSTLRLQLFYRPDPTAEHSKFPFAPFPVWNDAE